MLGKRLNTPFHRFSDCNAYVAHHAENNLLLVQPDTYFVVDNHQCMRRIVRHFPVEPKKSVLVYHEPSLPLGTVEYMVKGRTEKNSDLHALATEIKSEAFPRIAVGIQYPDQDSGFEAPVIHQLQSPRGSYNEYFLLNKFPQSHWVQLHEEVVPKVFAAIDKAVADIRAVYPQTDVDELNPLRAESSFGTDIANPPEVSVGPKSTPLPPMSKSELQARLWEIRRQRESDPEFKRLIATGGRS